VTSERRTLAAIAAGGVLGTLARYEIAQAISVAKDSFPWATFWTNLSGAFVLGAFVALLAARSPLLHTTRVFFGTGFCGAYTTFSTMAVETVTLVKDGHAALGIGYIVTSIAAGLLVAYVGGRAARAFAPRLAARRAC
jgi:fluoride exporter